MGKRQRCTYAKGEPASSLRSQPGKDGWGRMGGGQHRRGWNEERVKEVGERYEGAHGTNGIKTLMHELLWAPRQGRGGK